MSHRTAGWLAWSLWAVCVLLIGLAFLLDFVTRTVPVPLRNKSKPWLHHTDGGALVGIPNSRGPDRLAPPH